MARWKRVSGLMKNLLFLCTGNDDLSRFCEAYFNPLAMQRAQAWWVASRRLTPDVTVFRNPGPPIRPLVGGDFIS
jgi:hypothetical protein